MYFPVSNNSILKIFKLAIPLVLSNLGKKRRFKNGRIIVFSRFQITCKLLKFLIFVLSILHWSVTSEPSFIVWLVSSSENIFGILSFFSKKNNFFFV